MELKKGNGGANNNHKSDFRDVGTPRATPKSMPAPNTKNTRCDYGPLQPTRGGKR